MYKKSFIHFNTSLETSISLTIGDCDWSLTSMTTSIGAAFLVFITHSIFLTDILTDGLKSAGTLWIWAGTSPVVMVFLEVEASLQTLFLIILTMERKHPLVFLELYDFQLPEDSNMNLIYLLVH